MPVHTRSLSRPQLQSWGRKSDLRPQLVSGHENLQSDGFMVDVDGKYFLLKQLSKISTPFFHEKCRFTWNSKWFYKWMDHALFQQKNDHTVFISTDYTSQTTCRQTVVCANPAGTLRTHFYFGNHLEFHLELQVILQVNGSQFFVTEKWSHGTFINRLCLPENLPANCDVCELCV